MTSIELAPRAGHWMLTNSGRQIWPIDPRPGDFTIADIAHGLSNVCRYGGQCKTFYSVAQHCVLVSEIVEEMVNAIASMEGVNVKQYALCGLMHDASEAYIGDMVTPLKRMIPDYYRIEKRMMDAIFTTFNLPADAWGGPTIARADRIALLTERRDILHVPEALSSTWAHDVAGLEPWESASVVPMDPLMARGVFLARFKALSS